jgi:hypothetical protein
VGEKERITDKVAAGEVSPTLSRVLEMEHIHRSRHVERRAKERGHSKEADGSYLEDGLRG